ncbi:MAG: O-antigen ligase family protein [Hyphomicrobiales bacterium]|nr:MAG: O-antigen ligase family protein [Hyphomicrobiales bacterium]
MSSISATPIRTALATGLTGLIALGLFGVATWYGNFGAYVAMGAALLGLLLVWNGGAYREVLASPGILMQVAAFVLLAIAILAVADSESDRLFVFDFSPMLMAIPAAALFARARVGHGSTFMALVALAGTFAAASVTVYQGFILGAPRVGGWQNSPIHFGDLAVIVGYMSLGGVLLTSLRWRALFLIGPVLGGFAAVMSGSRSSIIVAIVLAPFALYFLIRHSGWRLRNLLIALAIGAAIVGVAAAFSGSRIERMLSAFTVIGETLSGEPVGDSSFRYRLDMYQAGWKAFLDSPIFGHGWRHQMEAAFPYLTPDGQAGYQAEHWGYIHNEALSLGVGMGVLGFIAYVLLMAHPLALLAKAPRDTQTIPRTYLCLTVVIGVFVAGLTDVHFMAELFKTFYCFIPAAICFLCRDAAPPPPSVTT